MSRYACLLLLVLSACGASVSKHGIILPVMSGNGRPTYAFDKNNDKEEFERARKSSAQFIPSSLLGGDDGLYAQARSCAIAYNDALAVYQRCSGAAGWLRLGQLLAAGGTVLSSGVGPNTSNDVVKRHWTYAGLGSAGALALLTGFDLWLNCGERTVSQQALAAQRLATLHNAGHLAACAVRLRDQPLVVDNLKSKLEKLNRGDKSEINALLEDSAKNLRPSEQRLDAVFKELERLEATDKGGSQVRQDDSDEKGSNGVDAKDIADAKSAVREYVTLKASLCQESGASQDGASASLRVVDYFDLAHAQLIKCLEPSPILFNPQSTATVNGMR